ncbi:hypothetical protein BYT27DRAFT_7258664 [Phlegmacium glaucopus]|nr:hypothetical protein BYT27DRAFT_7258664 [Phlegmacium glaucopus]
MSNGLSGLCNGCIDFYRLASAIPQEFMENLRIMELLTSDGTVSGAGLPGVFSNLSSTANSILSTAVAHQETASESRIGVQVRRGSTKSEPAGLACFKNLQKSGGGSILAEQKDKKTDWVQQQLMTGPKFSITLWKCWGIEEKPKQLFAQKNTKVGASIEYLRADEQLDSAMAGTWLKEFVSQRLGTNASLKAGILNICFIVDAALIPDTKFEDKLGNSSSLFSRQPGFSARPSTALASKRQSADSALNLTLKHPNAPASSTRDIIPQATPGFREPGLPASVMRPMTGSSSQLSSAQATLSCQSHTLKVHFGSSASPHLNAKYQPSGDVKISRLDQLETIAIAEHWLEGEKLSKEKKHYKTGFIGRGFTKQGIYARYNNKEYVVTQPFNDNMSFLAVQEVLIAEFKLLVQCDGIKQKFDEFIQDAGVEGVPQFCFNFKDSFYGEIEPLSASGCHTIPYLGFLTIPLLPCGRFDDPIQKFTGSNNLGPANDNLTQAIHAFVHFAWAYSQEQLLFCDMQGIHDQKNIMCLIDPRAHITNPCDEFTIYWDGGANKIATWKEQHLLALPSDAERAVDGLCKENWVCSILELSMIEMEDLNDEAGPGSSSTTAEKAKIGYVLNH